MSAVQVSSGSTKLTRAHLSEQRYTTTTYWLTSRRDTPDLLEFLVDNGFSTRNDCMMYLTIKPIS